ncbi:MAG: hypothetical protein MSH22_02075 [Spirochaetia bacterium]|nr:hypothetical protein [Spirochaetia bacterium]
MERDVDRSVDSMDFAMCRRFTFIELKANECLGMLDNLPVSEGISKSEIIAKITALNEEIEKYQVFHQHITLAEAILQNSVNILIRQKMKPLNV